MKIMPHRSLTSIALGGVILIVLGASGVVTARSFQQSVSSESVPAPAQVKQSHLESSGNLRSTARQFGELKSDRHKQQVGIAGSFEIDLIADQPRQIEQRPFVAAADIADAVETVQTPALPDAVVADEPLSIQPLHRVQLAEDGLLPGRLSLIDPAAGDRVALQEIVVHFVRNGTIVSVVEPGVGGVFQASGLTPGIYSVIATGPGGLLASSVEIVPPLRRNAVLDGQPIEGNGRPALATALEIRGNPIPAQHLGYALRLIRTRLSAADFTPATGQRPQPEAERAPAPRDLGDNRNLNGTNGPPVVQTGTSDTLQAVYLRNNGQITGAVRRLDAGNGEPIHLTNTEVYIIQNAGMTGPTQADDKGRFSLQGVRPGVASFVAIGPAGFAAFSFEVRPPSDSTVKNFNQPIAKNLAHVAFVQNEGVEVEVTSQVDAALVDPIDFAVAQNIIDEYSPDDVWLVPPPPAPFQPGPVGFGGGGAGGGGGGGGLFGGNLGGILLGAGVGAGVGAAVASNRSRSERIIVVSPANVD
jgi:hypothetical protein